MRGTRGNSVCTGDNSIVLAAFARVTCRRSSGPSGIKEKSRPACSKSRKKANPARGHRDLFMILIQKLFEQNPAAMQRAADANDVLYVSKCIRIAGETKRPKCGKARIVELATELRWGQHVLDKRPGTEIPENCGAKPQAYAPLKRNHTGLWDCMKLERRMLPNWLY